MEPQAIRPTGIGVSDQSSGNPQLPNPTQGGQPFAVGSSQTASAAASAAVSAVHASQQGSQQQSGQDGLPFAPPVPQHLQINPGPQVGAAPGALNAAGVPQLADDSDLIEKEWVVKAKQITAQTKADPFLQSIELNKLKAEYIKKRYNKDIKIPEN